MNKLTPAEQGRLNLMMDVYDSLASGNQDDFKTAREHIRFCIADELARQKRDTFSRLPSKNDPMSREEMLKCIQELRA